MVIKTFNVSFPAPLARRFDRAARQSRMNRSELLRSLARGYLDRMGQWDQMAREFRAQADKHGIRTMDDIDRIVHEVRGEIVAERAARQSR